MRIIGRLVTLFIVAIIVIALWRASNGNIGTIMDWIWNILNQGANIVTDIWKFFSGHGTTPTPISTPGS